MSAINAPCPSCGAEVTFSTPGSAATVCSACQTLVARADAANLGKIADVQRGETPLALGVRGSHDGDTFTLVGHTLLKSGDATWDEWYAYFPVSGRWGWLSYAQGEYYLLFQSDAEEPPPVASLVPGTKISIGENSFLLAQRGDATYIQAAGELPFAPDTSKSWKFADFTGRKRAFATIGEYNVPILYVGVRTTLRALNMDALPRSATAHAVPVRSVTCPKCSGHLELHTGQQAIHVACAFCGALLDATQEPLKILQAPAKRPLGLDLPLGRQGELQGVRWRIVGFMNRETQLGEATYTWDEYLLHAPDQGFRWLVQSYGHWTFVQPAEDVIDDDAGTSANGTRFQAFQRCTAQVTYVLGEFYWPVRVGEQVDVLDFVAPPLSLSRERTADEDVWSLGTYVSRRTMERAFLGTMLPPPVGIAPGQPWPHQGYFKVAIALCAMALLLYAALYPTGSVVTVEHLIAPQKDQVMVTEPIALSTSRNVAVRVQSPVGAASVDATWVAEVSPDAPPVWGQGPDIEFALDVDPNDDETVYLSHPRQPRGHLRLQVRDVDAGVPALVVTVYESAYSFSHVVTMWAVCGIWTLLMGAWRFKFDSMRWEDANV